MKQTSTVDMLRATHPIVAEHFGVIVMPNSIYILESYFSPEEVEQMEDLWPGEIDSHLPDPDEDLVQDDHGDTDHEDFIDEELEREYDDEERFSESLED